MKKNLRKICSIMVTTALVGGLLASPISSVAEDDTDIDGSFATANILLENREETEELDNNGKDEDYYSFTMPGTGYVEFKVHFDVDSSLQSVYMDIYDEDYKLITEKKGSNSTYGTSSLYAKIDPKDDTEYYIKLWTKGGRKLVSYSLKAEYTATNNYEIESNDTRKLANKIDIGKTVYGFAINDDDYDYFTFKAKKKGSVTVKFAVDEIMKSGARGYNVYLCNSSGKVLASKDSIHDSATIKNGKKVKKGTKFYVLVRPQGGITMTGLPENCDYTLKVKQ